MCLPAWGVLGIVFINTFVLTAHWTLFFQGSCIGDCCIIYFCWPCTLCQEAQVRLLHETVPRSYCVCAHQTDLLFLSFYRKLKTLLPKLWHVNRRCMWTIKHYSYYILTVNSKRVDKCNLLGLLALYPSQLESTLLNNSVLYKGSLCMYNRIQKCLGVGWDVM